MDSLCYDFQNLYRLVGIIATPPSPVRREGDQQKKTPEQKEQRYEQVL